MGDAIEHRHVVGVVTAEQHALGARLLDQKLQRLIGMRDGVVEKAADDGRRLAGIFFFGSGRTRQPWTQRPA